MMIYLWKKLQNILRCGSSHMPNIKDQRVKDNIWAEVAEKTHAYNPAHTLLRPPAIQPHPCTPPSSLHGPRSQLQNHDTTPGSSEECKMWSNVRVAAVVVVALLAVAEASYLAAPSYHRPAPCYPETKYVTQYQTQVKEVPVYKTQYQTQVVPTTIYQTQYQTQYQTVYKTQYQTQYVTQTEYKTQVQYQTQYETVYKTQVVPQYITTTHYQTQYKTQVQYQTQYVTQTQYQTVYKTQIQPQYITTTQVQYKTQYQTKVVPQYHTVTQTQHSYKTVCPKPSYGSSGYGY
ncbi:LOW QUALITY PROTEIN: uncharacterized protein LOC123499910 [Portunus trituberculatus]|uniref:LOW QUALITY PROTEIN: uncharacterized protein LOC123499910 n=1 Tax=Portunus trituberculatus TaxID=210409 RepID=UPI001E1CC007|nr:LOW QUALITY PROTEIN: uncharacterized protein LOC123499910 [Portunus trituberculatus]